MHCVTMVSVMKNGIRPADQTSTVSAVATYIPQRTYNKTALHASHIAFILLLYVSYLY